MKLLLYCFSRQGESTPRSILGIDGKPVKSITKNGIQCFYSTADRYPTPEEIIGNSATIDENVAIKYHRVIIGFHKALPILPFRYGSIISSEEALISLIDQNINQIFQALNQFEFTSENSFLVTAKKALEPETPKGLLKSDSPGVSYLRDKYKKLGTQQPNDHKIQEIKSIFSNLLRENMIDIKAESQSEGIKIHLLNRKKWSPSALEIEGISQRLENYQVKYLGDFPPYHFIKLNLTV
ncbi:MAG: GvpL/GvpF family gas vesicle protein [Bacteroidota bacterium]